MAQSCCLSPQAENYLRRYDEILSQMIAGMTGAELKCSLSYNFIVQMIPHHQAAIEMCRNLLRFDPEPALVAIAESIIREQTQSVANMRAVLPRCAAGCSPPGDLEKYQRRFREIAASMFCRMRHARRSGCIGRDFLTQMIPHHRGAISMAGSACDFPLCPELRPILCGIITNQCRGVAQMEQLLRQSG